MALLQSVPFLRNVKSFAGDGEFFAAAPRRPSRTPVMPAAVPRHEGVPRHDETEGGDDEHTVEIAEAPDVAKAA